MPDNEKDLVGGAMATRRKPPSMMMRVGVLLASAVLLTGAALWAGSVGPWIGRPQAAHPATQRPISTYLTGLPTLATIRPPVPLATAAATPSSSTNNNTVLYVLGAVLLLALLLLAAAMITNGRGRAAAADRSVPEQYPVAPSGPVPDPDRLFDAREAADYVIARWDELEHQAAARGGGRRREQTPTEFIQALQSFYPMDGQAAAELLGLYQHARFDHVRLLPDTAVRARVCADTVIAAIASSSVVR